MTQQIDLLVIGGGPAGYSAAIRASQLGKTVVVAERERLGGTCLNRGCIPTKALLESAHFYAGLSSAAVHGVEVDVKSLDYGQVVRSKDQIVENLVGGLQSLLRKRQITVLEAEARFLSSGEVQVGAEMFQPANVLVATGTEPLQLRGLEVDGELVVNSDQLLARTALPESLVIIGGGVIGCEFATIFSEYGVQVTIVELMPRLLPMEDGEISQALAREFKKRKVKVFTGAKVVGIERGDRAQVSLEQNGNMSQLEADLVLVAVGRRPVLPAGFTGELDAKGCVRVNEAFQTSVPNVYAAGDIIGGVQLAHLAFEEGWAAVNNMFGLPARREWFVPACVYTKPEIASVGLTEAEARERHGQVISAKFSLKGNGRAMIARENSGFVKVVAAPDGRVLGVHIIGPQATELISGAALALEQGLTLEKWAEVVYPHPTVSESIKEAVLSALGCGLHSG